MRPRSLENKPFARFQELERSLENKRFARFQELERRLELQERERSQMEAYHSNMRSIAHSRKVADAVSRFHDYEET